MLNIGAANGCRGLGPKGQHFLLAVVEGVHLLLDDVGILADAAGEELRFFHDRDADLPETEIFKQGDGGTFDELPQLGFTGQDILESADQLDVGLAHGVQQPFGRPRLQR